MIWRQYRTRCVHSGLAAGIIFLFLLSCKTERPPMVLDEPEMITVLLEIYQAEEKVWQAYIPFDSVTKISPLILQRILNRVNVSDSVFRLSMDYYMENPKKLDRIYSAVVDSLSIMEQRMLAPDALPR